jgi:hypothetical protein
MTKRIATGAPEGLHGAPNFIGPVMPPMIAWQRTGEPGWPFHHAGGPLPGTINYPEEGCQLEMSIEIETASRDSPGA